MTGGASSAAQRLTVIELDTERGWRGGERQVLWHAQVLVQMGHRAMVAARPTEPLAAKAREAGITVIPIRPVAELDPVAALVLRRMVLREGVHVVHAHTGHGVALGALACIGTRAKLVVTRHSTIPLRGNLASRWKYQRADALIAISGAAQRAMIASGVEPRRITIVHGGTDQSYPISPANQPVLEALGVPAGTDGKPRAPLVVQVSQLTPEKDPLTFVRAIHRARHEVPALHALLIGDGPLRAAVERAVAENGLGNVLHLAGYRADADALLAAADVITLSSKQDALPTVLFDALFCRKPICATDAGGIPEIVDSGVSGLLTPVGNGDALGASIARVLTDPALAARLAAAAVERAPEFSVERSVQQTVAVFERVLGSPVLGALRDAGRSASTASAE